MAPVPDEEQMVELGGRTLEAFVQCVLLLSASEVRLVQRTELPSWQLRADEKQFEQVDKVHCRQPRSVLG